MECKGGRSQKKLAVRSSINRNIMECKEILMNISVYGVIVVLIETLWNVKY